MIPPLERPQPLWHPKPLILRLGSTLRPPTLRSQYWGGECWEERPGVLELVLKRREGSWGGEEAVRPGFHPLPLVAKQGWGQGLCGLKKASAADMGWGWVPSAKGLGGWQGGGGSTGLFQGGLLFFVYASVLRALKLTNVRPRLEE